MYIFNKVLIKMNFVIKTGLVAIFLLIFCTENFPQQSNYSAWQFRDGNFQANKRSGSGFYLQIIDSFIVKWASPFISGEIIHRSSDCDENINQI